MTFVDGLGIGFIVCLVSAALIYFFVNWLSSRRESILYEANDETTKRIWDNYNEYVSPALSEIRERLRKLEQKSHDSTQTPQA